jgi:hypothetical protein
VRHTRVVQTVKNLATIRLTQFATDWPVSRHHKWLRSMRAYHLLLSRSQFVSCFFWCN